MQLQLQSERHCHSDCSGDKNAGRRMQLQLPVVRYRQSLQQCTKRLRDKRRRRGQLVLANHSCPWPGRDLLNDYCKITNSSKSLGNITLVGCANSDTSFVKKWRRSRVTKYRHWLNLAPAKIGASLLLITVSASLSLVMVIFIHWSSTCMKMIN